METLHCKVLPDSYMERMETIRRRVTANFLRGALFILEEEPTPTVANAILRAQEGEPSLAGGAAAMQWAIEAMQLEFLRSGGLPEGEPMGCRGRKVLYELGETKAKELMERAYRRAAEGARK